LRCLRFSYTTIIYSPLFQMQAGAYFHLTQLGSNALLNRLTRKNTRVSRYSSATGVVSWQRFLCTSTSA